jgi:hypothetical protein
VVVESAGWVARRLMAEHLAGTAALLRGFLT